MRFTAPARLFWLPTLLPALLAGCQGSHTSTPPTMEEQSPQLLVARGRVDVEGGPHALSLATDGVVSAVDVKEGDRVRKGQVLVTEDSTAARLDEDLAKAHLAQAEAQVRLWSPRLASARLHAARLAEAARLDAGDRQTADDAHAAAAETSAELANARAGVDIARADMERARYRLAQQDLRAPVDGDVLGLTAWVGMHVQQGATLLTVLPSFARIVRAELSPEVVDAIAPGTTAQILSDDGRQSVLGTGQVRRIGGTYGRATLQDDPLQPINEHAVECIIALDRATAVRVGQRVLVRFSPANLPRTASERLAKWRPASL
ncbi:HlyD family secretion protein [Cognatiluteimonas profundi]|uniref:HlyD family secretion protein n=1 Tax=Cognatiluteimonas profundi TaxID=2594501 RepID=UPI00131DF837|nr:HlyD family efflux transporter periplasmic adaptor subunit [Lysobacter profundi]